MFKKPFEFKPLHKQNSRSEEEVAVLLFLSLYFESIFVLAIIPNKNSNN